MKIILISTNYPHSVTIKIYIYFNENSPKRAANDGKITDQNLEIGLKAIIGDSF